MEIINFNNFDWEKYLNTYEDLKKNGIKTRKSAINHYKNYGKKNKRMFYKIKNKPIVHLITYGNNKYSESKNRIIKEGIDTNWFDTITIYSPNDLDKKFKNNFNKILKLRRGGGYWIWKPYFINKKLNEINDNEILVYLDCGCTINKKGENRFYEYIDMLNNSDRGIISFELGPDEKKASVKEIFEHFNVDINGNIANSKQFIAGICIFKKNKNSLKSVKTFYETLLKNRLLFTDYYNDMNKNNFFIFNRHDQSIFSIIRKLFGSIILKDETYLVFGGKFGSKKSLKYPFWATRISNGVNIKELIKFEN